MWQLLQFAILIPDGTATLVLELTVVVKALRLLIEMVFGSAEAPAPAEPSELELKVPGESCFEEGPPRQLPE